MHFKHQVTSLFTTFCSDNKVAVDASEHAQFKKVCMTLALECIFAKTDSSHFKKTLKPQELEDLVDRGWNNAVQNEVIQVWERLLLSSTSQEQS